MSKNIFSNCKKVIVVAVISSFFITLVGCADGPIRRLLRGGACNACNPPSSHPSLTTTPGCNNCGPGGQLPGQQPAFDGFSSNQPAAQGYATGYGGADFNGSYYQSNLGGATVNPLVGGSGSLGSPIVPPAGSGFRP